jgi:deazaflavin-dependent oxidoreductase (nitroreductase family)
MYPDLDRIMTRLNAAIVWLLRSRFHALADSGLMLITVTGRRSGKRYTIPVGYQQVGDHIDVLVSKARRKKWWRNYMSPAPVEVVLGGKEAKGTARVVAAGSDAFYAAMQQTFDRMPWLGGQFGIRYRRGKGLSGEQRRTLAREAAVVRIDLDTK